jgi:hypothetical protein
MERNRKRPLRRLPPRLKRRDGPNVSHHPLKRGDGPIVSLKDEPTRPLVWLFLNTGTVLIFKVAEGALANLIG